MATFDITYSDGTTKREYQHDCQTVEQMTQCRFGRPFPSNIKVTLVDEEAPAPKKSAKK